MKLCIALMLVAVAVAGTYPKDFLFGCATAAYQIEGSPDADGKGVSWWDTFSHTPNKIFENQTGDVACDSYKRYADDISLLKNIHANAYRFSIAWSRILPNGLDEKPNELAVAHYRKQIQMLLDLGITPLVTLYHWDLPQALGDMGGWLNASSADWFEHYADVAFNAFGDIVKYWITINEPSIVAKSGYRIGEHAPGRCSDRKICEEGDGDTEPYIVGHNEIRAHAKAYKVYKDKYAAKQGGKVGLAHNSAHYEPMTNKEEDIAATKRIYQSDLDWFAHPVHADGDYPQAMKDQLGDRLPKFTKEEIALNAGSADFFGLNHYSSNWCKYCETCEYQAQCSFFNDEGEAIGEMADSTWLYVVPWGIRGILNYIHEHYPKYDVYVTENGVDVPNEYYMTLDQALRDTFRVDFYKGYLENVRLAIEDGVPVKGYMAWSLMDNFEWAFGYRCRFGLHYVDFENGQTRYMKDSAIWYRDYIDAALGN